MMETGTYMYSEFCVPDFPVANDDDDDDDTTTTTTIIIIIHWCSQHSGEFYNKTFSVLLQLPKSVILSQCPDFPYCQLYILSHLVPSPTPWSPQWSSIFLIFEALKGILLLSTHNKCPHCCILNLIHLPCSVSMFRSRLISYF
jgi:hypothetical protein